MQQTDHVAFKAAPTIYVLFGKCGLGGVRNNVLENQKRCPSQRHISFSKDIEGIYHLRVSKTHAAYLALFGTKVNAAQKIGRDDPSAPSQLRAKINIFLPAIQRKALVKFQVTNFARAKRHIAPIGIGHVPNLNSRCRSKLIPFEVPLRFRN